MEVVVDMENRFMEDVVVEGIIDLVVVLIILLVVVVSVYGVILEFYYQLMAVEEMLIMYLNLVYA